MSKPLSYLVRYTLNAARRHGGFTQLARMVWAVLQAEGLHGIRRRLPLRRHAAIDLARFKRNTFIASTFVHGSLPDLSPSGGIAVVAHVFYPELFGGMANFLGNIPWQFDLYISVTTDQARKEVEGRAGRIPRVGTLNVRIVPNRGRDIAPLLVEFAAEARAHRYVLHIHTKKSLYSGQERTEWRDYLLSGLIGSEQRIRHIFSQLDNTERIGIVYPDTFPGLPYWAHTWLQNRGIALTLASRIGVDIRHMTYVDSPMGSMFWARSEALVPLLDLRLCYEEFPEERGQTDGTLHHTIERFFVIAANRAGLGQRVMLDVENGGTLFLSPGRKNLSQYLAAGAKERIAAAATSARVVSFDIFDTLLTRPWFSPDNLFDFLETAVSRRFSLSNFAQLRVEAERMAALAGGSAGVDIAAIYDELGVLIGDPNTATAVRAMEESAESAMLVPNAEVCDAARVLAASGKRLVAVSDMYLDEAFIKSLLAKNSIDIFDKIYVSNAIGKRKDNGSMWSDLPSREQVCPTHWQHVGDNEHSDVQRPIDAGYAHPVHVMRAADQFMLFNEEATDWIRPSHWQEGLLLGLLANRIFVKGRACSPIALDAADRSIAITSLRDFGYLAVGPALTAFMAWLMREARKEEVSLLLYASREGYLLKQAHDLIADRTANGIPDAYYFLCSRTSACLAALTDAASIDILLDAHFKGSLADLLKDRFGIDDLSPFLARLGEKCLSRPGHLPTDKARFRDSLEKCFGLLSERTALDRERYRQYAEPIIGGHRAAIVDIGYSATIQRALSTFLNGIAGGFYFVTIDRADRVKAQGQFAKGCFGDGINEFQTDLPIFRYSLLMEAILTAPHGQLLGFGPDGKPRFKDIGIAQKHFTQIEEVHRGALDFLGDSLDVAGNSFEDIGEHHEAAQLPIRQVMEGRWYLAGHTEVFHVEDAYSGNEELSVFDFYARRREAEVAPLDQ